MQVCGFNSIFKLLQPTSITLVWSTIPIQISAHSSLPIYFLLHVRFYYLHVDPINLFLSFWVRWVVLFFEHTPSVSWSFCWLFTVTDWAIDFFWSNNHCSSLLTKGFSSDLLFQITVLIFFCLIVKWLLYFVIQQHPYQSYFGCYWCHIYQFDLVQMILTACFYITETQTNLCFLQFEELNQSFLLFRRWYANVRGSFIISGLSKLNISI